MYCRTYGVVYIRCKQIKQNVIKLAYFNLHWFRIVAIHPPMQSIGTQYLHDLGILTTTNTNYIPTLYL